MSLRVEQLAWGHPLPGGDWRQLFRDFSFHCPQGQFVVVIGSNGSGKSTLLNLVAGTLNAGAGSIHLGDRALQRRQLHPGRHVGAAAERRPSVQQRPVGRLGRVRHGGKRCFDAVAR